MNDQSPLLFQRQPAGQDSRAVPALRFSPTAWGKLIFLRDVGPTEVGGFAVSAADDVFLVEDVQLVRQTCTPVSVAFDDQAVADFFDQQVDAGRRPEQFSRIWVHTHPGDSPRPSSVDEETFARVFGRMEWAVMFILAEGGQTYARLRFNVGPSGEIVIPVNVDFSRPFNGSDVASWKAEYLANVINDFVERENQPRRLFERLRPRFDGRRPPLGTDDPFWNEQFSHDRLTEEFFDEY